MTDVGGTKPVYTPITTTVDNNIKPTGAAQGRGGEGLLVASPNTVWVDPVPATPGWQKAVVSDAARAKGRSGITIGASEERLAKGIEIELRNDAPNNMVPTSVQPEGSSAGGRSSSDPVKNDQRALADSLKSEAEHNKQVDQAKQEALNKLIEQAVGTRS
jgi:hypothetical protein